MTIGYLVDSMATCQNSSGDTIVSMMVSRMVEDEGWMDKSRSSKSDPAKAALAAEISGCSSCNGEK